MSTWDASLVKQCSNIGRTLWALNHQAPTERESNPFASSCEEKPYRRPRRGRRNQLNLIDIMVEVPEFEGKLDVDEFLEWLHTFERVFDYKEIPEDKKVKIFTLTLRKYSCLWSTNLCAKRVRKRKDKVWTCKKMKSKLRTHFLPLFHLHDRYS